eukprot:1180298-Prymnesium_polylepis.1
MQPRRARHSSSFPSDAAYPVFRRSTQHTPCLEAPRTLRPGLESSPGLENTEGASARASQGAAPLCQRESPVRRWLRTLAAALEARVALGHTPVRQAASLA